MNEFEEYEIADGFYDFDRLTEDARVSEQLLLCGQIVPQYQDRWEQLPSKGKLERSFTRRSDEIRSIKASEDVNVTLTMGEIDIVKFTLQKNVPFPLRIPIIAFPLQAVRIHTDKDVDIDVFMHFYDSEVRPFISTNKMILRKLHVVAMNGMGGKNESLIEYLERGRNIKG